MPPKSTKTEKNLESQTVTSAAIRKAEYEMVLVAELKNNVFFDEVNCKLDDLWKELDCHGVRLPSFEENAATVDERGAKLWELTSL